jgi:hypothetical protein
MKRTLPLIAAAAALAGILAWQVATFAAPVAALRPAHQMPVALATQADATPPSAGPWVATALDRPLFRENRRPPVTVDVAGPSVGGVRLAGVITGPFGNRLIFMSSGESKPIVASEGARVGSFVVRSIGQGQATVEFEGGMRTLRPSFARNVSPSRQ